MYYVPSPFAVTDPAVLELFELVVTVHPGNAVPMGMLMDNVHIYAKATPRTVSSTPGKIRTFILATGDGNQIVIGTLEQAEQWAGHAYHEAHWHNIRIRDARYEAERIERRRAELEWVNDAFDKRWSN